MIQKHFMDISRAKFGDEITTSNVDGFEVGDIIQITEKWDGSNASIRYDKETGKLVAFSRKYELAFDRTLAGFWNYVQTLNAEDYKDTPNYVIFGEWGARNVVPYEEKFYKNWYVYDIFDVETKQYLPQTEVKKFVEAHGLTYIHVLYEGEFISWEHCQTFLHSPAYGEVQEGIVIKNQTKLNNMDSKKPFVLKIVNDFYTEVKQLKNKKPREKDQERENARVQAQQIVESIVTKRRVEKELQRLKEEGILPENITPQDMKLVAKNVPKRIYDDCMKEERELVEAAGEFFSGMCNSATMKLIKEIILQK